MSQVLKSLAVQMVAKCQDYSPEASKVLPAGQMMVDYGKHGVWVVDAADTCNLDAMPKLYRVDVDTPKVASVKRVTRIAKHVIVALLAVTLVSPALAWKHSSGAPKSYNYRPRSK
jgi:hypothetical protein